MTKKQKGIFGQAVRFVAMAVIMLFITFPFLVCLSNTFKTEGESVPFSTWRKEPPPAGATPAL